MEVFHSKVSCFHGTTAFGTFGRLRAVALVLACLLSVMAIQPVRAGSDDPVRLAAFHYPPFYWEKEGQVQGIGADLVDAVFTRMDRQAILTLYPLKRALEYAREGRIDGIMILIKTEERAAYLTYTDPVMRVRGLIWSRAGRPGGAVEFDRLEDLKGYKTGATLGYSYGQEFDRLLESMDVVRVASDYLNFKKLMGGRIDIFPANEIVARGLFKRHEELQGKFVHSSRSFIKWDLRMGISQRSGLVRKMPRINQVLAEIKDQGVVGDIVKEYTR